MKKIVLLLSLCLSCLCAAAQMMPDSTVQFVAYWNVGDKYQYNFESISKEINAQGDTSILKRTTEIVEFEVVAQTDQSYQVKMTTKESTHSDPQSQLINKIMMECGGNIPVLFTTTALGALQSIDNIPELVEAFTKAADPLVQALIREKGLEEVEGFDMQGFMQEILKQTADPAIIQNAIVESIGRLFFFHGARLDIDHTYDFEEPLNFMIPGVEQLTAKTNFWVDGELTDEYSAVCRTYTSADISKETLMSAIGTYANISADHMENSDSLKTAINEAMEKAVSDISLELNWEQYTSTEIHLGTGWPLRHYQDKYVRGGDTDSEYIKEKIESMYIEIILPE